MIFDSWAALGRVVLVGSLAYLALILLLRSSGKRTLTKLNAFDLVITVALGSTLATVLLDNSISLAEGVLALALLIFLQFSITWLSVRWEWFQHLVKAEPTLLVRRGAFLEQAMVRERVTREELLSVLRSNDIHDIGAVEAVVLETDGSFSVLSGFNGQERTSTLSTVSGSVQPGPKL